MEQLYFNLEINNSNVRCRNVAEGDMKNATGPEVREDGKTVLKTYTLPLADGALTVETREERITDRASRLSACVTNRSGEDVLVNGIAALYYRGIPVDGDWWKDKDRFSVWVCRNAWQGEGQWDEKSLQDLGLYPTYNHQNFSTVRLESYGSWTSAYTHPCVILCDKKANRSWCVDPEFSGARFVEIGSEVREGQTYLYIYAASAHARCGWHKILEPNASYDTEKAAFAMVEGGFEEAVAAMTEYRRKTSLVSWEKGYAPLCFNDYMNCLWAQPTDKKLVPLIAAAAEVGCEIFCIDAGWFGNWHDPATGMNGNWTPKDALFGEGGLQKIINLIKEKGMVPGLWLELESVLSGATFFREHPEYLATRFGKKIRRDFPDFRIPQVREYFTKQIDALCAMGVGYFKNDYNANLNAGCDSFAGGTVNDGTREYIEAFLSFIDETLARHPGLIIENCGSGAMRSDNGCLSHFYLQSTSDQEDYFRMPSIIQGSLAQMPPEKAGVWGFPYSLLHPVLREDPAKVIRCDEAETVYNMAAMLFGCGYMSGHIYLADAVNMARMKEGADFYKQVRLWTCRASAVYPTGLGHMDDKIFTLGLYSERDKKLLLGVFTNGVEATELTLDLSSYCTDGASLVRTYSDGTVTLAGNLSAPTLSLPAGNHAAVWEIDL